MATDWSSLLGQTAKSNDSRKATTSSSTSSSSRTSSSSSRTSSSPSRRRSADFSSLLAQTSKTNEKRAIEQPKPVEQPQPKAQAPPQQTAKQPNFWERLAGNIAQVAKPTSEGGINILADASQYAEKLLHTGAVAAGSIEAKKLGINNNPAVQQQLLNHLKKSVIPMDVAKGKASPLKFASEVAQAGLEGAQYVAPIENVGAKGALYLGKKLGNVSVNAAGRVATQAGGNAAIGAAQSALDQTNKGSKIDLAQVGRDAALAGAFGALPALMPRGAKAEPKAKGIKEVLTPQKAAQDVERAQTNVDTLSAQIKAIEPKSVIKTADGTVKPLYHAKDANTVSRLEQQLTRATDNLESAKTQHKVLAEKVGDGDSIEMKLTDKPEAPTGPETGPLRKVSSQEFDDMIKDTYQRTEQTKLAVGQQKAKADFEQYAADPQVQKARARLEQHAKVTEAIDRAFTNGPRHTIDDIVNKTAELSFMPSSKVKSLVDDYARVHGYDTSTGRPFKKVEETPGLAGQDGKMRATDEIQPKEEIVKKIHSPGVEHALPYGSIGPDDPVRQMVYKREDGSTGEYFEYRTPKGKWQRGGEGAAPIKSPNQTAKIQEVKDNAAVNAEAKRAYDSGTSAQYIWRENDAGVHSEFIREWDAAMGDAGKADKVDSNKIVSFDPDKHYIEDGKVVDAKTGQILGNYIEITPDGVNIFAGKQRISLNYNDLDLADIKQMKTSGITWTTEGIIDRITGNLKHTNTTKYFKSGGHKTKEALMHIMVEEPRKAQRAIIAEDTALGTAINDWEKTFNSATSRGKRAEMRRDAVYVIEPPAKRAKGGAPSTFEDRLQTFRENYGDKAADTLRDYDKFMRGVYDNLLVRMNRERRAIGQSEIKRRNDYITHIAEMQDGGILRQSIQGINNLMGGDVMNDTRGALPASITGTTGSRKPKSKYNPFSRERLADNKPLNPFDPLRVYSNLALQNIHMTKPITLNRALETTVRGLSEAKAEMSGSRGIQYVSELLDEAVDKVRNGQASSDELNTLSRKLFGLTRVFRDVEGVDQLQRTLRKIAKDPESVTPELSTQLNNAAEIVNGQLGKKMDDVDSLNALKEQADGLQQFVGIIQEHTNKLAGKTNHIVRAIKDLEKSPGTDLGLLVAKGAQQHSALTGIVGNLSSALNQAQGVGLTLGTTRPGFQLQGLRLMNNKELNAASDALWLRYNESVLARKNNLFNRAMEVGGVPLMTVEKAALKWQFAAKYAEAVGKGLDKRQAIKFAERWVGDTVSWRDAASAPRAYDRPLPASILQFSREVTQQYRGFWNRLTPAEKAGALVSTMVVTNALAMITGSKSGADPLGTLLGIGADVTGQNDEGRKDEDNTPWAKAVRAGQAALSEVAGDIPVASAVANTALTKDARSDIFGKDSDFGRFDGNMPLFTGAGNIVKGTVNAATGNGDQAWKDFLKVLPMGSQLQKTANGLQTMIRGYSQTSNGSVKEPVDQSNLVNWTLATLFGPNAIAKSNDKLSDEQSKTFKDLQKSDPAKAKSFFDKLKQSKSDKSSTTTKQSDALSTILRDLKDADLGVTAPKADKKTYKRRELTAAEMFDLSESADKRTVDIWNKLSSSGHFAALTPEKQKKVLSAARNDAWAVEKYKFGEKTKLNDDKAWKSLSKAQRRLVNGGTYQDYVRNVKD